MRQSHLGNRRANRQTIFGQLFNGQKTFITNGILSDLVIVVAKTYTILGHKGISLLVVEEGMAGFERGRNLEKIGLKGQDTAEMYFSDVEVPAQNLLGEEGKGFIYLMQQLPQERLVVGALTRTLAARKSSRTACHCAFSYASSAPS